MTDTARHQQELLERFAEALHGRYDHVMVTHAELSAAWPGKPEGPTSLQQLLQAIGRDWTTDHREGTGDYVFRLVQTPVTTAGES
jgi:hypothetical protein